MIRFAIVVAFSVIALSCGGKQFCSVATCHGCCSTDGICELGTSDSACGSAGVFCSACSGGMMCAAGTCVSTGATGGGLSGAGGGVSGTGGGVSGSGGGVSGTGGGVSGTGGGVSGTGGGVSGSGGGISGTGGGISGSGGGISGTGGGVSGTGGGVSGTGGGISGTGGGVGGTGGGSSGTCGNTSCAGCCQNGTCLPGADSVACGINGSACTVCSGWCVGGQCFTLPPLNGGGDAGTGSPCTSSTQCEPGSFLDSPECITERNADGGYSGWPAGYCSSSCVLGTCAGNGQCLSNGYCYSQCSPPGQGRGSCRQGYVCLQLHFTDGGIATGQAVCAPDCRNQGAGCDPGQTCNALGYCQ